MGIRDRAVAVPSEAITYLGCKSKYAYRGDRNGKVYARQFTCYYDACVAGGKCRRPGFGKWEETCAGYEPSAAPASQG